MIWYLLPLVSWAAPTSPAELIALGWRRVEDGDYDGARIVATSALAEVGDHQEEAAYLLGYASEWGGEPSEALTIYARLIDTYPDGDRFDDARFRRAETLGTLGRHVEAHAALKPLQRLDMTERDERKIQLLKGVWLIEQGRERRGLRTLRVLSQNEGAHPWYEAKAYAAQVALLARSSDAQHLRVGSAKQQRRLRTRATFLAAIEPLIEKTIPLGQTQWILEELLTTGRAYEHVGDDLLEAHVPRLSPLQQKVYETKLTERVDVVWTKALKWYQLGLDHTTRTGFVGPLRDELLEARTAVESKLTP